MHDLHTVANFDAKIDQYHLSKHYLGNTSALIPNGARVTQAKVFKQVQGNGQFVTTDIPSQAGLTVLLVTATRVDFTVTLFPNFVHNNPYF